MAFPTRFREHEDEWRECKSWEESWGAMSPEGRTAIASINSQHLKTTAVSLQERARQLLEKMKKQLPREGPIPQLLSYVLKKMFCFSQS